MTDWKKKLVFCKNKNLGIIFRMSPLIRYHVSTLTCLVCFPLKDGEIYDF